MSLEEARVEVERNIRLGMTRLEVLEYLNRTEWVYTDYFTVDHQVWARVYGSIRGFVVDGDLHLDLTFDDDEKLTEYTLEEAFTGP
jgi:hypothetical protein